MWFIKWLGTFFTIGLTVLLLSGCGGSDGSGSGSSSSSSSSGGQPLALVQRYPIDGVVDFSAFSNVSQRTVSIRADLDGGAEVATTNLRWAIVNDDQDIYFALEWDDPTHNNGYDFSGPTDVDGIVLIFDDDGDGMVEDNEDQRTIIAASIGSQYIDQHHVSSGDASDEIADGFGKLRYNAGLYQAEFLFPVVSDASNQDADLSDLTRYNIQFLEHFQLPSLTGNVGYAYASSTDSSAWPPLPFEDAVVHQRPQLPTGLTGLIAFVSTHEEPMGDIYTFNPATGVVTRVTSDPGLYKDNISLSHDRTRIAFHGAPSATDYANYEIYVVNVDGTGLTQLTNNSVLDGHPGWSNDDGRIVYASFIGSGGEAHLVVMDSANGAFIQDLTLDDGTDDNDPEYLPDGRIVFKTNRFSELPQVRIAVMDGDGTNVQQLTSVSGVSDHDPAGDSASVLFERFPKDTDYSTDIETGFINWDIVKADLDGGGEQTVLSDGWVNWLPVYDPTGQYIVYLKSVGYTAAHLMTGDGGELGRLIPGITRLKYIDWK